MLKRGAERLKRGYAEMESVPSALPSASLDPVDDLWTERRSAASLAAPWTGQPIVHVHVLNIRSQTSAHLFSSLPLARSLTSQKTRSKPVVLDWMCPPSIDQSIAVTAPEDVPFSVQRRDHLPSPLAPIASKRWIEPLLSPAASMSPLGENFSTLLGTRESAS